MEGLPGNGSRRHTWQPGCHYADAVWRRTPLCLSFHPSSPLQGEGNVEWSPEGLPQQRPIEESQGWHVPSPYDERAITSIYMCLCVKTFSFSVYIAHWIQCIIIQRWFAFTRSTILSHTEFWKCLSSISKWWPTRMLEGRKLYSAAAQRESAEIVSHSVSLEAMRMQAAARQ